MNPPFLYRNIFALAGLLILLPSCISVKSMDQADPYTLHHHNWWNYYRRGRLHLKDNNIAAARKDFQTALGQIEGARYPHAKDCWRARTYGMHIQEGYFPHRELGICEYREGTLKEAKELLETSMQMQPSARAKFYLNRIHEKEARAAQPPIIRFTPSPEWTNERSFSLIGTVSGPNPISTLTVDSEEEFIELVLPRLNFEKEIALKEGRNNIQTRAKDVSERTTTTNVVVMADWAPPNLHITRSQGQLSITCRDNYSLQKVVLNGITTRPQHKEHTLHLPINTEQQLNLIAIDKAGNQIEWHLSDSEIKHLSENNIAMPPKLHVVDAGKTIVLNTPEYILDLRAEDDTALSEVKLNGTHLLDRKTPLFRSLQHVPLTLGTNHLKLTAMDQEGNRTEELVSVIYRPPEYLDTVYRLSTTLSPLGGEVPDLSFEQRVNHQLSTELTRDPVRFYLLADQQETKPLKAERILSESVYADPRALLKQGRKIKADLVFLTQVLNDAPGLTIYTQVLDTLSAKELFTEDIYLEDPKELPAQLAGLIMKIEQRFPLIQAEIQQYGKYLTLDAGVERGIRNGMRFLVIRSNGTFEEGHVLHTGNGPAELVVSKIEPDSNRVVMSQRQGRKTAQQGDFVYSR